MDLLHISRNNNDIALLFLVCAVFVIVGIFKGVVGLGIPTLTMSLIASIVVPALAAVIRTLPSLLTNRWQMYKGPALGSLMRWLFLLQARVVAVTLVVSVSLLTLDAHVASMGLGIALIV